MKIWEALNGKKTAIGAAILAGTFFLVQFKTAVLVGIWHAPVPPAFDNSVLTAEWIGSVLSGVGLIHKAAK